jgi:Glycosyl hydrolases family 2, sugar binding domain
MTQAKRYSKIMFKALTFAFILIPAATIFGAQVEQLKNKNMVVVCRGAEIRTLVFNKKKILANTNLYLPPLSYKSGPSSVVRTSKVDLWYLGLSGQINNGAKAILKYTGKAILPTNHSFDYSISGTFQNDFIFKGYNKLLIYSWIDFNLFKGCRFEYYDKKGWHKGVMPTDPGSFSKSGIEILKVYLPDEKALIFSAVKGKLRIMRWKAKNIKQPFRFDVYIPGKKSFSKGDKFELGFSVKIISTTANSEQAVLPRKPIAVTLFQSEDGSDIITLDLEKLKGKLDFNGLSTIKVQDANGKNLVSQVEDRNLDGLIDVADVLVFRTALNKERWNGITLNPVYSTAKKTFKAVTSKSYNKGKIIFTRIKPDLYKIACSDQPPINVKLRLNDGLEPPASQGVEYLRRGIYVSEGPIRTRISVVLKHKSGLPVIKAFIFNQRNQTVTYASATMSYLGWGKQYLNIEPPGKYKNAGSVIAYALSRVNFLPLGSTLRAGTYGDWMSGWYLKDYTGITIGRLNERQSASAWAPNAYVTSKGLGIFYPTLASSFIGKAQISFINNKAGFTKALNRCKSFCSWNFASNFSALNKELAATQKSTTRIRNARKALVNQLKDSAAAGLYTASLKTKLEMVKVYLDTAKQALKLGRVVRYIHRVKKASTILAECSTALDTVKSKQLKLPVPPVTTKFYIGACMGRTSLDTSKTDFKGMYCDPAFYEPIKTVGLKDVQFHSFIWGNRLAPVVTWCNTINSMGLRSWPQMNMHRMPKEFSTKYPYYREWVASYLKCYFGRPFSPEYMKGFKQTDSMVAGMKKYYRNAAGKLKAADVAGFFAINEPTPHKTQYKGEMKEAFLYGFKNYLRKKYKEVATLNTAWDANYTGFSSVNWDNKWLTEKAQAGTSLNGQWRFKTDRDNSGIKQGWNKNIPPKTRKITVPGLWEKQLSDLKRYDGIAWYFKKLSLPRGKYNVRFAAVDDNATVYFNGKKLTRNIGYNKPFSINITSSGKPGLLAVRVEDTKGMGGIYRSVYAISDSVYLWLSPMAYPARCADYYDYRHQMIGDYVDLQTTAMEAGAPGKIIAVKEWTSSLEDNRFKNYCDPFIKVKADKGGYIGWDQYSSSNDFFAYQAALRQSAGNNRPSIIGEFGLNGGANHSSATGSGAIQYAENHTYRLLGRNVRGIFFFHYGNNGICGLLDQDGCIPDLLIRMGAFARSVFNLKGVFDSLLPFGETGIYFSRNDAYMASTNMVYSQVYSLFKMFYLNNLNPVIVDSITMPERMNKLKFLIVPSAPFISEREWEMITQFRENGGTVLVYANTGLMKVNNTRRTKGLLRNASYSGRKPLTLMGVPLAPSSTFGMALQKVKPIWRSSSGKTLLGKTDNRLYLSNLDIGSLYSDNGKKVRENVWKTISGMLKAAGSRLPVMSKYEVQYLENNSGDIFILVPGQGKEIKNLKFTVDVSRLKQTVKNGIMYDYLNLKKASVKQTGHYIHVNLDKHGKSENAIWWIGRK